MRQLWTGVSSTLSIIEKTAGNDSSSCSKVVVITNHYDYAYYYDVCVVVLREV